MGKSSPEPAGLTAARKYIAIKNNTRQTRQSGTKKSAVSMDKVAKRWGGSSFTVHRQVKALLTTGSPRVNLHAGRPTALTHGEEEALIAYCIFLQKGNFPALIEMVQGAANCLRASRNPTHLLQLCMIDGHNGGYKAIQTYLRSISSRLLMSNDAYSKSTKELLTPTSTTWEEKSRSLISWLRGGRADRGIG